MIRTATPLAAVLAFCAAAAAQPVIHNSHGHSFPGGVIPTPSLPFPGAPGAPSPTTPMPPRPRPYFGAMPYYGPWGYSPFWPVWYDTDLVPPVVNNTIVPVPVYVPAPVTTTPAPPPELRASLALTVPPRSHVWLGGKEVDANVSPLVLQSPVLQAGQSYTFDVKVTWPEGNKTEERTRTVSVEAGDQKSLAYMR
jgi:uncharacterized protein (TIGR03000 family)